MNSEDRKKRIEELKGRLISKEKPSTLFIECVESIQGNYRIIDEPEIMKKYYELFKVKYPISNWGKIQWDRIEYKYEICSYQELHKILEKHDIIDEKIIVLWDGGTNPLIEMEVKNAMEIIEEIQAVSFYQWFISFSVGLVIEIEKEEKFNVGISFNRSI